MPRRHWQRAILTRAVATQSVRAARDLQQVVTKLGLHRAVHNVEFLAETDRKFKGPLSCVRSLPTTLIWLLHVGSTAAVTVYVAEPSQGRLESQEIHP